MIKNLFITSICCILFSLSSNAQYVPDSSFGQNGYTISSANIQEDQGAYKLEVLGDNSILALGKDSNRFAIWKFTANGQFDNSFGINGKAVNPHFLYTNTTLNTSSYKFIDVAIANNGDIYSLLHKTIDNGSVDSNNHILVLIKFKANGQVDYSFGNNGYIEDKPVQTYEFMPYALATDYNHGQNGIGVGGIYVSCLAVEQYHAACAKGWGAWSISKYSETGIADSSFNNTGTILETTSFIKQIPHYSPLSVASSIKVLSNGDIKCAGTSTIYDSIAFTMQFHSDGTLNTNYGNNGRKVYHYFKNNYIHLPNKSQILDDGSVIFKSYRNYFNPDSFFVEMIHVLSNGNIDNNYGTNSKLTYEVPNYSAGYLIDCDKNQFLTHRSSSTGNTLGLLPFQFGMFDINGQYMNDVHLTIRNHEPLQANDPRPVNMAIGDVAYTNDDGILTTTSFLDLAGGRRFNIAKHKWVGQAPLFTADIMANHSTQVYPNPINGQQDLTIKSSAKLHNIDLYNSLGQHIYTKKLNNTGLEIISLPTLAQGYYFSKVKTSKGIEASKIIVR